jgi:hypothetical protein
MFRFLIMAVLVVVFTSCSKTSEDPKVNAATGLADGVTAASQQLNPMVYQVVMNELMQSTEKWSEVESAYKKQAVLTVIQLFKQNQSATISKPADFYVARVDQLTEQEVGAGRALPDLIRFAAVMEYDYDVGLDQDELAKKMLGPQLYELNRQRRQAQAVQSRIVS